MEQSNKLVLGSFETNAPDNTNLLSLLEVCREKNGGDDSYKKVMDELLHGNSFLLFPAEHDTVKLPGDGLTTEKDSALKISSYMELDGLKVLSAFTDEQALLQWTKKSSQYIAVRSREALEFLQSRGMNRIVINNEQPTMFVLEQSRENVQEHKNHRDTPVQLKTPDKPLNSIIIAKLIANFKMNTIISEVYQYGQTKEGEYSLVLGFILTNYTDNAKKSAINAVQNAVQHEVVDQVLDVFFIETKSLYKSVKKIEHSLLYKK